MAWHPEHKQESRERILRAAADLFTRKGFNQVGIDEVMCAAGLTRGAFYAHFDSKFELYEAAIYYAGTHTAEHLSREAHTLADLIDNYLSEAHLHSPDLRCPMSCLVSDVAHDDERIKRVYTTMLKDFTRHLASLDNGSRNADKHLLQVVLMIGGMAVARSLTDAALAQRILSLCKQAAKQRAG